MIFVYKGKKYNLKRYPVTKNSSLRAWNAADEYLLKWLEEQEPENKNIYLYNDRFGFLNTMLHEFQPRNIYSYKSQQKALQKNFENNAIDTSLIRDCDILTEPKEKIDVAIVKVPKSLERFQLFLQHLSRSVTDNSVVACGFMTKYFSRQMLEIAAEYFESFDQSLAWKKSRLLLLQKPKPYRKRNIVNSIKVDDQLTMSQYLGVFSAERVDPATRFLCDNLIFEGEHKKILDLGAGNGILTQRIQQKNPKNEFYLIDDSLLAIESAKMNLQGDNFHFYYDNNLNAFENNYFDHVISNPPFHFGHEINIEVAIGLFHQVERCLKEEGTFQLVANQHLNYKTHLIKYFSQVEIVAENEKYIIYQCQKESPQEENPEEFNPNIIINSE